MHSLIRTIIAWAFIGAGLAGTAAADNWKNITPESEPGLAGREIQVMETIGDELWIGTLSGLSRYRGGKFEVMKAVQIKKKRKWVKKDGKRKRVVEEVKEVKPAKYQAWGVVKTGKDRYLVGTNRGLFTLDGDTFLAQVHVSGTVSPVAGFGEKSMWALAKRSDTEENAVYRKTNGEWKPVETFSGKRVADMFRTRDGRIWVVIDGNGVIAADPAREPDEWVHYQKGMNIKSLFMDSRGRVWCGFWNRGIAVLDGNAWTTYLAHDISDSAVLKITEDKAGNIWAATNADGLWRYDGEGWNSYLKDEGPVNLLYAASDGKVWASTQMRGGLRFFKDREWHVSLDSPLPMRCIVEYKGALWAGGVLDGLHVKKM
ncbi:MAG: hypothetical protein R6V03_11335 [Kiritimatiellia bacterium]